MQRIKCQVQLVPNTEHPCILHYGNTWFAMKDVSPNALYAKEHKEYAMELVDDQGTIIATSYWKPGVRMVSDDVITAFIQSNGTLDNITIMFTDDGYILSLEVPRKDTFSRDELLDLLTLHEFKECDTLAEVKEAYPKSFFTRRELNSNWLNKHV